MNEKEKRFFPSFLKFFFKTAVSFHTLHKSCLTLAD